MCTDTKVTRIQVKPVFCLLTRYYFFNVVKDESDPYVAMGEACISSAFDVEDYLFLDFFPWSRSRLRKAGECTDMLQLHSEASARMVSRGGFH